jgi:O-antigen ligase/tetratricopeptide (TPR) repeat protein
LARWILCSYLLVCPLLFSTATAEAFEENKAALLTLTATLLAALGLGAGGLRGIVRVFRHPPDLLALGFALLALSAVLSTFISISPRTSWRGAPDSHAGLRTILGYLVLFVAARILAPRVAEGRGLLAGAALAAVAAAGYSVIQAAGLDPVTWDNTSDFVGHYRPFGTLGHAILLAAYLAMSLPILLAFAKEAVRGRFSKTLIALAAAILPTLAGILLSLSRAAWLAAVVSLAVFLTLCITRRQNNGSHDETRGNRTRLRWLGVGLVGCLSPLFIVCVSGAFRSSLTDRLHHLDDDSGRRFIWQGAWSLFTDRPLLGWGPDTLRLAFGRHRPSAYADVEWNTTPTRAHNVVVNILATQGVVGAATLLLILVGLVRSSLAARRQVAAEDQPYVAGLIACLAAFLITQMTGFCTVACGSLFAACAGMLSAWGSAAQSPIAGDIRNISVWRRWGWYGCVVTAATVLVWTKVVRPLGAQIACRDGDRVVEQDADAASSHYLRAAVWDPVDDRYPVRQADVAQRLASAAVTPSDRHRCLKEAEAALSRAASLVPQSPYHHANLARVRAELAPHDLSLAPLAFAEWDIALSLDPANAWFLAEAARTAMVLNDRDRLQAWADRCIQLYPRFAPPHAHIGAAALREGRFSEAVEALHRALQREWHDDQDGAERARASLAAAYLGLQRWSDAAYQAREVLERRPRWATAHYLLGQALVGEGRRDEALYQFRQALSADPEHAPSQAAINQLQRLPSPDSARSHH